MNTKALYELAFYLLAPCISLVIGKKRPTNLKQFMLFGAVLFFALGFLENITYFVDYLPHKELYTIVDGRISDYPWKSYHKRTTAYACFDLNGEHYGNVPVHIGFFENSDTAYRFGVRIFPSGVVKAVRIQPVLNNGTVLAIIWEIWGILMYLIKPAWEDE